MIRQMGQLRTTPGARPAPVYAAPPRPVVIASPPVIHFAPARRTARTPATTRPLRTWINRAGLGEISNYPCWRPETRADGSVWMVDDCTGAAPMLSAPAPAPVTAAPRAPAPALPVAPQGPTVIGVEPGGVYVWQLPGGSIVRGGDSPPASGPAYGDDAWTPDRALIAEPMPGDPMALQTCPPYCGPGGGLPTPPTSYAQTPSPPPPAPPSQSPPSPPGVLPTGELAVSPNFSDPAGVGSPYSRLATEVIATPAPSRSSGPTAADHTTFGLAIAAGVVGYLLFGGGS